MNLDYVREFITLTETKNFAETAERVFSSQSTISKHLKQLEKELGTALFSRTSRRVEINDYGRLFLPYAKSLLKTQYEYQTAFYNKLENISGILKLGSIPAMAQYNITDIIMQFKNQNKNFSVDVIETESADLKFLLRKEDCELAFIRDTGDADEDLTKIPYFKDHMAAVLPVHHPLAGQASINLSELSSENFIFLKENTFVYNLCMDLCREAGFTPHIFFSGHRIENITDFVAKNMGVSLLMKQQTQFFSAIPVSVVEISPTRFNQIYLAGLKNRPLSPAAKHFIHCMETTVQTS